MKATPEQMERQARYLFSVACLVKDAAKHDELQRRAQELLAEAKVIHEKFA
jgi:hypothetical protein